MTKLEYHNVLYSIEEGIATITLNRPNVLNAVNNQMSEELQAALKRANEDTNVRVIVLTGAGRGFCAGEDLSELLEERKSGNVDLRKRLVWKYNPIVTQIWNSTKPTVCSINGVAAGAGASFALACDIKIASEKASFVMAFTRVGLVPDSGMSFLLPRLIGYTRAIEAIYLADTIDAKKAEALGLVNRVVPHEELEAQTKELAKRLATGPTKAFALAKRALIFGLSHTLEETLEYESLTQGVAAKTQDHIEGVSAFIEKRKPNFTGR